MLLEFKIRNYKSFLDEADIKMTPTDRINDLDYSVLKEKAGNKEYRGLCSSLFYGPNASGKTALIEAFYSFKQIIFRGHIRNPHNSTSINSSQRLELIPNSTDKDNTPTLFFIKFISDDLLIEYSLEIDLGGFLKFNYERKIVSEKLSINENLLFERSDDLTFGSFKSLNEYFSKEINKNLESMKAIARESLNKEDFFLTNGFKTMFSPKLVTIILNWLENQFLVFPSFESVQSYVDDKRLNKVYTEELIEKITKVFGIKTNGLTYRYSEEENKYELYSVFYNQDSRVLISSKLVESQGMLRFMILFPVILDALEHESTLIFDDFDSYIHPMIIMDIINIFHNDDLNIHQAQLIFNCHDPLFINSNLFRRDEIQFIDKNDSTLLSSHYSLSDFKTSGINEDYMNHYLNERYGAIRDIYLEDMVEEILGIVDSD